VVSFAEASLFSSSAASVVKTDMPEKTKNRWSMWSQSCGGKVEELQRKR